MKKYMFFLGNNQLKGTLYITISAVAFASYGIWSKLMGEAFGDWSQGWIRGLLILMILIPIGIWQKSFKRIERQDILWFLIFSLGGLNQAPIYYAFHNLTIGTATVLFYAALVIAGYVMGYLVFKERIDVLKIVALVLALAGISTLFRFSFSPQDLLPALSALIAGAVAGIEVTITKKISGRYSTIQILTSVFVMMVAGNLVPSLLLQDSIPTLSMSIPWLAQMGYAVAMLTAMYSVVRGFKYLSASTGSLIGLSEILFAALFGVVFFNEHLSLYFLIASICILTAAAIPYLRTEKA